MISTPLYGHTILHAHAPLTLAHSHSHTSSYLTTPPFTPAQVMLNKEVVIRQLYRSEVLWLVYCCQSRALGKRITAPELPVGDAAGREGRGGEARGGEGGCCCGLHRRAVDVVVVVVVFSHRCHCISLTPTPSPRTHAQGIDWDGMDHEGRPLKPEPLRAVQLPCEPSDAEPPGMGGPAAAAGGGGEEQPMMRSGGGEEGAWRRGWLKAIYRG